ncbi:MFS transporter [Leuconostoc lactis]|uniref:MFS transporter n=1 Tax=Leuconostoc lactis TaxID=1246 RepID=UPI00289F275A|nr:MFS transporter [Leuconostoc lactis]
MTEKVALKELLAIVALSVVAFSGIMAETAMNVTFTVLSQEFNRDLNRIQWVTTLYLLAVTIMITTSAFLIKRFNSRWLWLSSVFIFLIGTLLSGFAPNTHMAFDRPYFRRDCGRHCHAVSLQLCC